MKKKLYCDIFCRKDPLELSWLFLILFNKSAKFWLWQPSRYSSCWSSGYWPTCTLLNIVTRRDCNTNKSLATNNQALQTPPWTGKVMLLIQISVTGVRFDSVLLSPERVSYHQFASSGIRRNHQMIGGATFILNINHNNTWAQDRHSGR